MRITTILGAAALMIITFGCKKESPESSFTTEKDIYNVKQSIPFTNTSENGTTYYWNFGDGESSSLKNPGHTYAESGEYIVTLQVQGAKKATPAEFNKIITILDENDPVEDVIFANSVWIADSLTQLYYSCTNPVYDYSLNSVNSSLHFKDDNTVLMLNNAIGNVCEYEILNDTLIGFFENPYYNIWSFSIDGDRLTLTRDATYPCPDGSENTIQGNLVIQHFYRQ